MNLTIIGAGAIGGTVGAFLTKAGHDVTVVDIVREHVDEINAHGLRISGIRGDQHYPLKAVHTDNLSGSLHNVILAVKGHFTHDVVTEVIAPRLAPDGWVLSLQNGLNEDTIAAIIGRERTIGAFVHFGADYLEPGHILLAQNQDIFLGELNGATTSRIQELQQALSTVMPTHVTSEIYSYLWGKLVYGSMAFAVSTIDAPVPEILSDARARRICLAACRETARVGNALGHDLKPIGAFEAADFLPDRDDSTSLAALDRFRSEMAASIKQHMGIWRDLKVKKRPTEVDVQCGEVVRYATELGIDVPLNRAIVKTIHQIETGERDMSWDNLDALGDAIPGK